MSHFEGGKMYLPTGNGMSLCYCLLPKAFDCLRQYYSLAMQFTVGDEPINEGTTDDTET